MKLKRPVTIVPPEIVLPDGSTKTLPALVFDELNITIIDNANTKTVEAKFDLFPYGMILWSGSFYDRIGDYTQKQVEDKILETIKLNPAQILKTLFKSKIICENKLPAVSSINIFSNFPLSAIALVNSYYSTYSSNSAFRSNPYSFLISLSGVSVEKPVTRFFIPTLSGS
ncbi:MAG: hypothetical protein EBU90_00360 [Proteobacteria bacterium]|nr:hypothetical protein [Pseudomonadota bacterium]NBP12883.1 hypothetical protein [bacterium]